MSANHECPASKMPNQFIGICPPAPCLPVHSSKTLAQTRGSPMQSWISMCAPVGRQQRSVLSIAGSDAQSSRRDSTTTSKTILAGKTGCTAARASQFQAQGSNKRLPDAYLLHTVNQVDSVLQQESLYGTQMSESLLKAEKASAKLGCSTKDRLMIDCRQALRVGRGMPRLQQDGVKLFPWASPGACSGGRQWTASGLQPWHQGHISECLQPRLRFEGFDCLSTWGWGMRNGGWPAGKFHWVMRYQDRPGHLLWSLGKNFPGAECLEALKG